MRRYYRSYRPSNYAQKDISRFNTPPNGAQKGTLWFNKVLILLHSGQRPPLYFVAMFVREEQCLIISHSHSTPQTRYNQVAPFSSPLGTGAAYCRVSRGRGGQGPRRAGRRGGEPVAEIAGGALGGQPRGLRAPGQGKPRLATLLLQCSLICITRPRRDIGCSPPRRGGPKGRGGFLKCPRGLAPDSRFLTPVTSRPCESTPSGRLPRAAVRGWPGLQPNGAGDYPWVRCLCWYH